MQAFPRLEPFITALEFWGAQQQVQVCVQKASLEINRPFAVMKGILWLARFALSHAWTNYIKCLWQLVDLATGLIFYLWRVMLSICDSFYAVLALSCCNILSSTVSGSWIIWRRRVTMNVTAVWHSHSALQKLTWVLKKKRRCPSSANVVERSELLKVWCSFA